MEILPSGYKRLLYIESTGSQYVDTGFKPSNNTKIQIMASDWPTSKSNSALFGTQGASSANRYDLFITDGGLYRSYYNNALVSYGSSVSYDGIIVIERDGASITMNGEKLTNTASTFTCTTTLWLFAHNTNGAVQKGASLRMYFCKMWDNGTLARNYIPCENESGVVGLYDTVSGTFNAGVGTFIAGPEWGYVELEYIESTGEQYINTEFRPNQDTRICMDVIPKVVGDNTIGAFFFGSGYPAQENGIEGYAFSGTFCGVYNGIQFTGTTAINAGDRLNIDFNKNVYNVTRDGISVYNYTFAYTAYTSPINLHLLVLPRQSKFYGSCKLYSCKIYDNDTIIRDYIPAKLTDGSVGLLDKLTEEFYPNMGTGKFIAGPELYGIDEHVLLMIHGTEFADDSSFDHDITNNGAILSADVSKFGGSMYFGGSANLLLAGNDFDFGTGDFTIDAWIRPETAATDNFIFSGDANGAFFFGRPNDTLIGVGRVLVAWDNTVSIASSVNTWSHVAVCRSSGIIYFFVNGSLIGSFSNVQDYSMLEGNALVGCQGSQFYYNGYIEELRVSNIARYTSTFAVQAGPYTEKEPEIPIETPVAPESIIAPYADFANILLMWSAVPSAEGYNVTRDGELIATTGKPFWYDSGLDMKTAYSYSVTAYNAAGESEAIVIDAETTEFKLITDRTNADVQAVLAAINTGTLPDNWFSGLKGAYNATDFNRVESAVLFVIERLKIAGWYLVAQTAHWTMTDLPTASEMHRYLENVRLLRAALPVGMPAVPDDMDRLTYTEANTIEQILEMLDAAVTNIMQNVYYSNELYSGEVQ